MQVPSDLVALAAFIDRLIDNGYLPVVMRYGTKAPARFGWQRRAPTAAEFVHYAQTEKMPPNVGLRLDGLVVVDIDSTNPETSTRYRKLVEALYGETPLRRVGSLARGGAMIYRAAEDIKSWSVGPLELKSGSGQSITAYGLHPEGNAYHWPDENPMDIDLDSLPLVTAAMAENLRLHIELATGHISPDQARRGQSAPPPARRPSASGPLADGRRVALLNHLTATVARWKRDGRSDDYIRTHLYSDAQFWFFGSGAIDLTKPKCNARRPWNSHDVEALVKSRLRHLANVAPMQTARTWTREAKRALLGLLLDDRRLTEVDLRVATALLDAHRGDDDEAQKRRNRVGGLAAETIAGKAGCHRIPAHRSRAKLVKLGYFHQKVPGRRRAVGPDGRMRPGKAPVVVPNDDRLTEVAAIKARGSAPVVEAFRASSEASNLNTTHPVDVVDGMEGVVAPQATGYLYEGIHPRSVGLRVVAGLDRERKDIEAMALKRWPHLFQRDAVGAFRKNDTCDPKDLASALRTLQALFNISQTELARRIGIHRGSLSNMLRGHDMPSDDMVRRFFQVLSA